MHLIVSTKLHMLMITQKMQPVTVKKNLQEVEKPQHIVSQVQFTLFTL